MSAKYGSQVDDVQYFSDAPDDWQEEADVIAIRLSGEGIVDHTVPDLCGCKI